MWDDDRVQGPAEWAVPLPEEFTETSGEPGYLSDRDIAESCPEVVELCRLARGGALDLHEVWRRLGALRVFTVRPEYYGLPIIERADGELAAPVFSSLPRLGAAVGECAWVCLSGGQLLDLPLRPRWLVIDPGSEHEVMLRLPFHLPAEGAESPADPSARPYVVDIHRDARGHLLARTGQWPGEDVRVVLP